MIGRIEHGAASAFTETFLARAYVYEWPALDF